MSKALTARQTQAPRRHRNQSESGSRESQSAHGIRPGLEYNPIGDGKIAPQSTTAPKGPQNKAQGGSIGMVTQHEPSRKELKQFRPRAAQEFQIFPVTIEAEVQPSDSLHRLLRDALKHQKQRLHRGDILVIKHKIVSKAEGQFVDLQKIIPSAA